MPRTISRVALALFVLLALATPSLATVRIATVTDGPWERNEEVLALFREEITRLVTGEFDVVFPEELAHEGDWTLPGVRAELDAALADDRADLVLAMGVLAGDLVSKGDPPRVPVIAPFVLDRELQGLPFDAGASGRRNLSYLDIPNTFAEDLDAFREIVPFERLVFLTSPAFVAAVPGLAANLERWAGASGLAVTVVTASGSAEDVLAQIPEDTQAIYMAPLPQLRAGAYETLLEAFRERGLPSFSFLGRPDVERGALAGLRPESFFERLARRTALHVQRILLGDDAGALPVAVSTKDRLVINMATAREIGVYPSFSVLTEAELIDQARTDAPRVLSLADVVAEAARRNLELAAAEQEASAAGRDVGIARGRLLPDAEISAMGLRIDEDRAAASLGSQAEQTLSASASVRQVIWSEPAWAASRQASHQRDAAEASRDAARLDAIRDAAVAYLQVLIAKTVERIERTNLELTRSNLELAQVRESVGTSGPSEVLRWKSAIASGRRSVIRANAQRNVAEMSLNVILDRGIEEPFATHETSIDDSALVTSDPRLGRYLDDPWTFRVFREFMAREGLDAAPEIARIDAAIRAQSRALASATNSFFSPTIALEGSITRELDASGAGSDGPAIDIPGVSFPSADETDWSIALVASLPLFRGGSRVAERRQAADELLRLRLARRSVANGVEFRTRAALHRLGASRAGIALARDAADAAERNLDVVTDAYRRGVADILALLDAQNAALVAEQGAASAVFEFLIDLVELERAVGRFDFFTSLDQRDDFFERLATFVEQNRTD